MIQCVCLDALCEEHVTIADLWESWSLEDWACSGSPLTGKKKKKKKKKDVSLWWTVHKVR